MAVQTVFLGDDFTGASDSLATYARAGLRARLDLSGAAQGTAGLDVLGLATDLRSLAPSEAEAAVARLWPRIAAAAPRALHLKVCSTFDSAPQTGSIGAVARALAARFRPDVLAVIGGQPDLGRHCAFGTLFARGPDGAVHRIDRHPVMSRHPVTPMLEADLRRHLALQGLDGLGLVALPALADTAAAAARLQAGPVLVDAACDGDLVLIAAALRRAGGRQLLVGASSVARILGGGGSAGVAPPCAAPTSPGIFAFAGSRSSVTAAQVAGATAYARLPLPPGALGDGASAAEAAALLRGGTPVLAHLLPDAGYGLSPGALADRCSDFVCAVMEQAGAGWLGLAGGDTSSRICARLGFSSLAYRRSLGPGVPVCAASHADPRLHRMRIMLKGGQMGAPGLFDAFASMAAATRPHPAEQPLRSDATRNRGGAFI
ncbi:four-carbon acid sugar kinase family protein [Mangrovicoccus sp. HB161399]|uniref:four-carbon acid sugar kinase family protein n=1 Tax=Mangrovicoccus sp. HB161399 TaxID=2720392 RepID=UPI00155681BB|nr:four-carbon acid sugar kinase family protein [Mangrovicoccus sp. HB161399]